MPSNMYADPIFNFLSASLSDDSAQASQDSSSLDTSTSEKPVDVSAEQAQKHGQTSELRIEQDLMAIHDQFFNHVDDTDGEGHLSANVMNIMDALSAVAEQDGAQAQQKDDFVFAQPLLPASAQRRQSSLNVSLASTSSASVTSPAFQPLHTSTQGSPRYSSFTSPIIDFDDPALTPMQAPRDMFYTPYTPYLEITPSESPSETPLFTPLINFSMMTPASIFGTPYDMGLGDDFDAPQGTPQQMAATPVLDFDSVPHQQGSQGDGDPFVGAEGDQSIFGGGNNRSSVQGSLFAPLTEVAHDGNENNSEETVYTHKEGTRKRQPNGSPTGLLRQEGKRAIKGYKNVRFDAVESDDDDDDDDDDEGDENAPYPQAHSSNPSTSTSTDTFEPSKSKRDRKKIHHCPVPGCPKVFSRLFNLNTHVETHNPHRNKPYPCNYCDKSFARKHDLHRHEGSVHRGERKFTCPSCQKGFSRKDALTRHRLNRGCEGGSGAARVNTERDEEED
ncbi:hypothetical protein BZG36_02900 [Bifiguratus adelaidae]|uniref:C2H2-type domain-containing protein n=1 Tax=Bifiguratus adelaidae TaxID=1938954 RepID=A0A261Y1C2_9FUNG|nr:hypothetical protein BZG36_02900 [Bifiguratus adelaidae]